MKQKNTHQELVENSRPDVGLEFVFVSQAMQEPAALSLLVVVVVSAGRAATDSPMYPSWADNECACLALSSLPPRRPDRK